MSVNIQETLNKIMAALPEDVKKKVQSCKSKEDFLALIGPASGLLGGLGGDKGGDKGANPIAGILSGVTGSDKGGANPLAGLMSGGNPLQNAGDLLKGVDWSEIQKYLRIGK